MDREAVVRTLETDRARLLAYVWSMLRDHHAGEDLYQDLLVVAMSQAETFNDAAHLLKWSRLTLRNKAMEHLRQGRSRPVTLAGDVLDRLESHWSDSNSLDSAEMTRALQSCLASLTQHARHLIELRYGQGLRGTDVAKATDRKPHTVYVALSRAYKVLADCINSSPTRKASHV